MERETQIYVVHTYIQSKNQRQNERDQQEYWIELPVPLVDLSVVELPYIPNLPLPLHGLDAMAAGTVLVVDVDVGTSVVYFALTLSWDALFGLFVSS